MENIFKNDAIINRTYKEFYVPENGGFQFNERIYDDQITIEGTTETKREEIDLGEFQFALGGKIGFYVRPITPSSVVEIGKCTIQFKNVETNVTTEYTSGRSGGTAPLNILPWSRYKVKIILEADVGKKIGLEYVEIQGSVKDKLERYIWKIEG